jgi:hypothetical protein
MSCASTACQHAKHHLFEVLSVKTIKDVEHDMDLVILKRNNNANHDDPHNLFVSEVSGLCEDPMMEDALDLDDNTYQIFHEVEVTRTHKCKIVDKSTVRCSSQVIKNQPIYKKRLSFWIVRVYQILANISLFKILLENTS